VEILFQSNPLARPGIRVTFLCNIEGICFLVTIDCNEI
jgi:hypothetical protein